MRKVPKVGPAGLQPSQSIPRQINMAFESVELQGLSEVQRTKTITRIASLLMQAGGVATAKERDDEEC